MYEIEMQQAEKNIIEYRKNVWIMQKANELTREQHLPRYKAEEMAEELSKKESFAMNKGTLKIYYDRGFYLLDSEEFFKLPKKQREQILKTGRKKV